MSILINHKKRWSKYEDSLILGMQFSDEQLSRYIQRSVTAIAKRRKKLIEQRIREEIN